MKKNINILAIGITCIVILIARLIDKIAYRCLDIDLYYIIWPSHFIPHILGYIFFHIKIRAIYSTLIWFKNNIM